MLDDVLNRLSADAGGTPSFSAADYFLGIAQRIASANENTRIVLPGKGEITLAPSRGAYYANIPNMMEFCQAPASQFEITPLGDAAIPYAVSAGKSIKELLWQAAFHASQGRLIDGCSKYDVVQFRHWPNLTRLPITPNAMRICALLTRHPTTIMLVHRQLGIDTTEIYQIYSAAHSAGVTNMVSKNPESANVEAEVASDHVEPTQERSLFRSLFAKIAGL